MLRAFWKYWGTICPGIGLSKFGDPARKPNRVTFDVEVIDGGFICDVHPSFACYISDLLTQK